jgi:hypothetical protein
MIAWLFRKIAGTALWGWLGTRAATFWVAGFLAVSLGSTSTYLVYKYKDMEVRAARCEAASNKIDELNKLRKRLEKALIREHAEDKKEALDAIEKLASEGTWSCLDERVPDSLRGQP